MSKEDEHNLNLIALQQTERELITATWGSLKESQWLRTLQASDFTDQAAKATFNAIRDIQSRGEELHYLAIQQQMTKDKNIDHFTSMLHSWTGNKEYASVILSSEIKALVQQIERESCVRRVQLACRHTHDLVSGTRRNPLQLQEMVTKEFSKAFSRMRGEDARSEREILTDMANSVAESDLRQIRGEQPVIDEMPTGFADIDEHFGGGGEGQLIMLAARPSVGKSALGLQFAREWARHGEVYFWSGEMSARQIACRAASQHFQMSDKDVKAGRLYEMAEQHSRNVWYDCEADMDMAKLAAKVELFAMLHPGIKAIVIDYLGLLCDNEYGEVSKASKAALRLAKSIGVPLLLLVQLSRKVEDRQDKTPVLADLRDSGQLEQDAYKVLMIYRPSIYDKHADPGYAEVWLRKHREGPRDVCIPVGWDGTTRSFGRWGGTSAGPTNPAFKRNATEMQDMY